MRLTLKSINEELAKRGHTARVAKARSYFYFQFAEAADWLDRTVNVPTVSSARRWREVVRFTAIFYQWSFAFPFDLTARPSPITTNHIVGSEWHA
jgi:hypothetical protein